ncbi:MAG: uroporphyrinogen decarboxylase family protein [Massiliimalia sp.]|jgi:uroporphyrinogen decarboxylase
MTGKERMQNILQHKPVDRIGLYEHFWNDTYHEWQSKGHLHGEDINTHFDFDMMECWAFNLTADLDYEPEIVAETEETVTIKDGNGAILRRHKLHDTTPEHVDFTVKDREGWEKIKPFLLKPDRRRINFEAYRKTKELAAKENRFFVWSGVNVFECMHPVCGHENLLIGMALDPEWVMDMADTYSKLTIELQKILFEEEGYPDGIWYYEDMGFKERPFMSPDMYCEMLQPYHKRTIEYAHSHNMPVIMHSCGFVEPLLPHMIEAGIDCLQVIEIKAGMDLLRIHKNYGDKIALMGGIDVRALYSNDKETIDKELEAKIPMVKQGFGYVLHSDHSIPKTVDYETYQYFIKKGLELGTY